MRTHTFSANIKGTYIQVKAQNKQNALKRYQMFDSNIELKDISKISTINSHQSPVEVEYPELFK